MGHRCIPFISCYFHLFPFIAYAIFKTHQKVGPIHYKTLQTGHCNAWFIRRNYAKSYLFKRKLRERFFFFF